MTFGLPPVTEVMLSAIMYGGTLSSVLINVPRRGGQAMTAVDSHKLAKQGRAGAALSIAAIGSTKLRRPYAVPDPREVT